MRCQMKAAVRGSLYQPRNTEGCQQATREGHGADSLTAFSRRQPFGLLDLGLVASRSIRIYTAAVEAAQLWYIVMAALANQQCGTCALLVHTASPNYGCKEHGVGRGRGVGAGGIVRTSWSLLLPPCCLLPLFVLSATHLFSASCATGCGLSS